WLGMHPPLRGGVPAVGPSALASGGDWFRARHDGIGEAGIAGVGSLLGGRVPTHLAGRVVTYRRDGGAARPRIRPGRSGPQRSRPAQRRVCEESAWRWVEALRLDGGFARPCPEAAGRRRGWVDHQPSGLVASSFSVTLRPLLSETFVGNF